MIFESKTILVGAIESGKNILEINESFQINSY